MIALVLMAALAQVPEDPVVGQDSALHFVGAGGIAGLSYVGTSLLTDNRKIRIAAAILVPLTVGVITSLRAHDELPGRVIAWSIPGAIFGAVFSFGVDWDWSHPQARSKSDDCTEIGKDADGWRILVCRDGQ